MKVHTQKKLGLLVILLTIFQTVSCNQAPAESLSMFETALPSEFDNRDLYNFEEIEAVVDPGLGQSVPVDTVQPMVLEDKTVSDYFTTKKIKTLITQETKNGKTIRTTKTWTTRNPSYLTWANAGLAATAIGAAGLYASGLNVEDIQKAAGNISSNFGFGKQNDAPTPAATTVDLNTNTNADTQTKLNSSPASNNSNTTKNLPLIGTAAGITAGGVGGTYAGMKVGGIYGAKTGGFKGMLSGAVLGGAAGGIAGSGIGGYAGYKGGEIIADNLSTSSTPSQSAQDTPSTQNAPAAEETKASSTVDGNDIATIAMTA
jgi:hypothetical protein